MTCPQCRVDMGRVDSPKGVFWTCPQCDGRTASVGLLREILPGATVNALWQEARSGKFPGERPCPVCQRAMAAVPVPAAAEVEQLDVCTSCHFVWFDRGEYAALPPKPPSAAAPAELPPKAREQLALLQVGLLEERGAAAPGGQEPPDSVWKYLPAVLGMPVECDTEALRRRPWVTWGVTAVVAAVSLLAFAHLREAVDGFGLVPAQWYRLGGLTLLTSFLLHAGWVHLGGNLYFLLTFGDNVEDYLGRWRYAALLAAATMAGHLAHVLGSLHSAAPCIGASGGISGVLAYYALRFPYARIGFMTRLCWLHLPAFVLFGCWVLLQVLGAYLQIKGFSQVSALAHLGGATAGLVAWVVTRPRE